MIALKPQDKIHKAKMQQLLIAIADNVVLSHKIYFKGGTCASMLGFLDRFSVDLDFDLSPTAVNETSMVRQELESLFHNLGFVIDNKNDKSLFFILKYKTAPQMRNTLKISVFEGLVKNNVYRKVKIKEIDRFLNCQTIETMYANKLVTVMDRYNRHEEVAGRDIYDIHYFFSQGYNFKEEIINERTGLITKEYIKKLIKFIEEKITDKIITEDLNTLLPTPKFNKIRKTLRQETLLFLKNLL